MAKPKMDLELADLLQTYLVICGAAKARVFRREVDGALNPVSNLVGDEATHDTRLERELADCLESLRRRSGACLFTVATSPEFRHRLEPMLPEPTRQVVQWAIEE